MTELGKVLRPGQCFLMKNSSVGNLCTWAPCWPEGDFLSCSQVWDTSNPIFFPSPSPFTCLRLALQFKGLPYLQWEFSHSLLCFTSIISDTPCISNSMLVFAFWRTQLNFAYLGLVIHSFLKAIDSNIQWPVLRLQCVGDLNLCRLLSCLVYFSDD